MLTRRGFLQTTALAAAAQSNSPKRIAILADSYAPHTSAQQMVDRILVGYPYAGEWRRPNWKVAGLWVKQKPAGELSADRAREFGFPVFPGIAETLRAGGSTLAVDAVLIFDGDEEFADPCLAVFEHDGHAVPVFHHLSLSASFEKARKLVDASRRLRFPLLAGSSIPHTWRLPSIDLPLDCRIEEALMVGVGRSEGMDFHAVEGLQCMLERRAGGESGVKAVQLLEGDAVWKAGAEGRYSKELLTAALSRSDTPLGLTEKDGRTQDLVASGQLQVLATSPAAYLIEYRDGVKASLLMLDGAIKDFNFAARLHGVKEIQSTQFLVTPEPNATHSACLMRKVEEMIATGAATYPVERALLSGGILESALASKRKDQSRVETPHLSVAYKAPRRPQFAQA
jgi:hypothetical protein